MLALPRHRYDEFFLKHRWLVHDWRHSASAAGHDRYLLVVALLAAPAPYPLGQDNLLNWIKLMLPVQSPLAKIFWFTFDPNHLHLFSHPGPLQRDVSRSSRT